MHPATCPCWDGHFVLTTVCTDSRSRSSSGAPARLLESALGQTMTPITSSFPSTRGLGEAGGGVWGSHELLWQADSSLSQKRVKGLLQELGCTCKHYSAPFLHFDTHDEVQFSLVCHLAPIILRSLCHYSPHSHYHFPRLLVPSVRLISLIHRNSQV